MLTSLNLLFFFLIQCNTMLTNPCFSFQQCSKEKTRKNCNNKTSSIQTGGVKFRSRKRVYAEQMTPKVTRLKKSIAQQDASLIPSDICMPATSQANAGDLDGNLDDHTQAAVEGQFYCHISWLHSINMSQL